MASLSALYYNEKDVSKIKNLDLTGIPATCILHVPFGIIDELKTDNTFASHFKEITSGACDFTYGSTPSNVKTNIYRTNVISNTPITVDGVEYAGTAEYVNAPGMKTMVNFLSNTSEKNGLYGGSDQYLMVKIGDHCFDGATRLEKVRLNAMTGLKEIGSYAFKESGITQLEIPESCTNFGIDAFAEATNLKDLILLGKTQRNFYGAPFENNASGFTCFVHPEVSYHVYDATEGWWCIQNGKYVNSNSLVGVYYDAANTTHAMCVPNTTNFADAGVQAFIVTDYGQSGPLTTEYVESVPGNTGVILDQLTVGKRYMLRPTSSAPNVDNNNLVVASDITSDATYYEWNEDTKRFVNIGTPAGIPYGVTVLKLPYGVDYAYTDIYPNPDTPMYLKGDVDGNGVVDVTDATTLINIIVAHENENKYNGRADVNTDGSVDYTDVNAVINIYLGK